ncbi:hypothetical protein WA026_018437 [Henosepilachna vigintioctopunctata]|uniref:valine--tRNA ligase n=1 Tax=Henosepilachna vigintioctopunctata TaxID=420089 RepID=A0AAW1V4I7_9CUCU
MKILEHCTNFGNSILLKSRNKGFHLKQWTVFNSSVSDLDAAYVPNNVENEEIGRNHFEPPLKNVVKFSMLLPPPNITGNLHLGHALTGTIQDIFIDVLCSILYFRKRMQGINTLWVPGLDHAGIATQVVVEKQLWNENGKTRHDLGREKFQDIVWNWKLKKTISIESQLRRLGLSLNWNKQVFTMDTAQAEIVFKVSAISDIEVDHLEVDGSTEIKVPGYETPVIFGRMVYFAYKICGSSDEIVVATTRPETIMGDVAVAVHPNDDRYSKFIGKKVFHPFRIEEIPIIADDSVDMDYGTGAVKVTPAHDHADLAVAKRHSLPILQVFDDEGKLTNISKDFQGLPRFEVRTLAIDLLDTLNHLRVIKEHKMTVPICSRSGDVIEFMMKPQWFVSCSGMAQKAMDAVRDGQLVIEPKIYEEKWFQWLENIRDWCISRQLWWGHRIPAYLCRFDEKERWIAAKDLDSAQKKASSHFGVSSNLIQIKQDNDVLDTWFSSSLLPFSVFGWPKNTEEFSKYYPLSLMETGHDILFFWVARMVMLGTEMTGQLPFRKVLLHGIICDSQGRKMSKSLGNVISPESVIDGISLQSLNESAQANRSSGILSQEELKKTLQEQKKMFPNGIPECGADALRYTLVSHDIKNHFISFDVQECHINKLFCNKIWQATKFTKMSYEKVEAIQGLDNMNVQNIGPMDKWILSKYSHLVQVLNDTMENGDFYIATNTLKNFLYYDFCDVYLESTKRGLREPESKNAAGHCWTLITALEGGLRALHPFMPFVTQHLHRRMPSLEPKRFDYPKEIDYRDELLEETFEDILDIVRRIRRLKQMFNVKKHDALVQIICPKSEYIDFKETIKDLSKCESVLFREQPMDVQSGATYVKDILSNGTLVFLNVPEELRSNLKMDASKLTQQKGKLEKELQKLTKMVSGDTYDINVSTDIKKVHQKRISDIEEKIARIDYILGILKIDQKSYIDSRS